MSMYENIGMTSLDYIEEILHLRKALAEISDECSKAYDKIANLEQQRWVSVIDEIPEYDKQVLLYDKDNGYRVVTFEYDDTQNCNTKIFINGENYYESISCVLSKDSCWTSLPTPPKGEQ